MKSSPSTSRCAHGELVDKGVDPRIAREMVLARLGDAARLKRTCVDLGRKTRARDATYTVA